VFLPLLKRRRNTHGKCCGQTSIDDTLQDVSIFVNQAEESFEMVGDEEKEARE